jgi:hypothetical protein
MTAIRRQRSFVQLDQVLHLAARAVDVRLKMLRRTFERGDDIADVDLLACRSLLQPAAASTRAERALCAAVACHEAHKGADSPT